MANNYNKQVSLAMKYIFNIIAWIQNNIVSEKQIEEMNRAQGRIVLKGALNFGMDLTELMLTVQAMLPELSDCINQFHSLVESSKVNVTTDVAGNMSWSPSGNMTTIQYGDVSKKLSILDQVINSRFHTIQTQLAQSNGQEVVLMSKGGYDPADYPCSILEQERDLDVLKAYYRRY